MEFKISEGKTRYERVPLSTDTEWDKTAYCTNGATGISFYKRRGSERKPYKVFVNCGNYYVRRWLPGHIRVYGDFEMLETFRQHHGAEYHPKKDRGFILWSYANFDR